MNIYPVWWDTTITIFNKYQDPQTQVIQWFKTVVPNCFWKYVGDKVSINNTILETNSIICRIPKSNIFFERYEWEQLPNDVKATKFTLGPEDIIVRGSVSDDINEYVSGHRSTDLLGKYKKLQGCMQIDQVAINVGAGRCNEHYCVRGI